MTTAPLRWLFFTGRLRPNTHHNHLEPTQMKTDVRSEIDVFSNLAALTRQPGYINAVAEICYRDNFVKFSREMKPSDLQKLYSRERLIRTEITTIIGLMAQGPIDFTEQPREAIQRYIEQTDHLMRELHDAMICPMWQDKFDTEKPGKDDLDIWRGPALREPIFYGGESAYSFQYRDLALDKYRADNPWLIETKGFSIEQAHTITRAMCMLLEEKMTVAFSEWKNTGNEPKSWLAQFEQSANEIAARSGMPSAQVSAFLNTFTLKGGNPQFRTVTDFNALNATPLLPTDCGTVLFFQQYGLYEALYESPFYWMMDDGKYQSTAARHRGAFTEEFSARCLSSVFPANGVHCNVLLEQKRGITAGEVDVLVVFGNRVIVLQAKAKKLTLAARGGNDKQLRKDFANAIQDSYDQALLCAQLITKGECKLLKSDGTEIVFNETPKEIFIVNIVAEHYPALAFQARQFLKYETTSVIRAPYVMDVFLIDALTEMLTSPLRLLSYVSLRLDTIEKLHISHELTALGFHLKRNLWLDDQYDMVMLEDDIAVDLDLAMTVRREGVPGANTPKGILTRLSGTLFEHLIHQIERNPDPATLELGLLLLTLGEDTCKNIHHTLQAIMRRTKADGKLHDFTIAGQYGGITFYCNPAPSEAAMQRLGAYCHRRKYEQRAKRWFGLSVSPNGDLQFAVVLDMAWQQSDEMDALTANMRKAVPVTNLAELIQQSRRTKTGRNDPCPCGSGLKHKKCCL